jgi:predicted nucleic acid-binding protein
VRVVVADTSPINYLVLIESIDLLRRLYRRVVIPEEVLRELSAPGTPAAVAAWIQARPEWIEVRPAQAVSEMAVEIQRNELEAGELAAISIALRENDSLLVIDEWKARVVASRLNLSTTGTLGVLLAAARNGWVDFREAMDRLRMTNFRISQALIDQLIMQADTGGVDTSG